MFAWFAALPLALSALACGLTAPATATPVPTLAVTPTPFLTITLTPFGGTPLFGTPFGTPLAATITPFGGGTGPAVPDANLGTYRSGCQRQTQYPTDVVGSGETLSDVAARNNTTVQILYDANCLFSADQVFAGQILYIPPPGAVIATSAPGTGACATAWFFTFNPNLATESVACPQAVVSSPAAGQDFQGGRAYYYAAASVFNVPLVYVIYNDGTWAQYVDTYNPTTDPSTSNEIPPGGLFAPVRAIGKVWSTVPGVRERLGWGFASEADFAGRRQYVGPGVIYIDHGVRNTVLRLDSTTNRWEVVGGY
jgi:LysM repeat protein